MTQRHPSRSVAAITSRGRRRHANEDTIGLAGALLTGDPVLPLSGSLYGAGPLARILADGMGGHPHGALASREAAAELMSDPTRLTTPEGCSAAIRQAHLRLHDMMLRRPETVAMGTTVAGVAVLGNVFRWFNVGDSRVYHLREKGLERLGHDDRRGAATSRAKHGEHGVLQCLGGQLAIAPINPHTGTGTLLPGDSLLVCSDGLTDMVGDQAIMGLMRLAADTAAIAMLLLQAALDAGGLDNVSVVLVR